jgi:hypothetical protein
MDLSLSKQRVNKLIGYREVEMKYLHSLCGELENDKHIILCCSEIAE